MGLDMYLEGRKSLNTWEFEGNPERGLPPNTVRKEDGFIIDEIKIRLGYWRKHPNLHGYIVEKFANKGKDNCEPVMLSADNIKQIIEAIKADKLPHTTGFFFGVSYVSGEEGYDEQKAKDITTFETALNWLASEEINRDTSVFGHYVQYQASW